MDGKIERVSRTSNTLVLAVAIWLSVVIGAGVVLFGLQLIGLERYTTGAAGQVTGIAGALAGVAALFGYFTYRYYREAVE